MFTNFSIFVIGFFVAVALSVDQKTPFNVRVKSSTSSSQMLIWENPRLISLDNVTYTIEGTNDYSKTWTKMTTSPPKVTSLTCEVINLLPNIAYRYKVAVNIKGEKMIWSKESSSFKTMKAAPVQAPDNISGRGISPEELQVTWQPLHPKYYGSKHISYAVAIAKAKFPKGISTSSKLPEQLGSSPWKTKFTFNSTGSSILFKVNPTEIFIPYFVKIQAINECGDGPFSKPILAYTIESAPTEAPSGFKVECTTAYSANISWTGVDERTGFIQEYKICLCNVLVGCKPSLVRNISTKSSLPSFELTNLLANNLYMMKFAAVNLAGDGPWSAYNWSSTNPGIMFFNTAKAPPGIAPFNVHIEVEGQKLFAGWLPLDLITTEIIGYYVEIWNSLNETSKDAHIYKTEENHIIVNLDPETDFEMRIGAFNNGGLGKPTQVFAISTKEGSPNGRNKARPRGGNYVFISLLLCLLICKLL